MNQIIKEDLSWIEGQISDWSNLKNTHILITGANGMIASYMVYTLLYLNETIPNMNIHISACGRNKDKMISRFQSWIHKDYFQIIDFDANNPYLPQEKVDYIIHAASLASSQFYSIMPVDTLLPNVIGTGYLLDYAKKNDCKGFLFFSSGDVYGNVIGKEFISESDFGWLDPLNIHNCYSESKRMGEAMCKAWQVQYGVPTYMARIFHTYGPTMDIETDKRVFSEFVNDIVHSRNIVMKSDGSPSRMFCYIADAITALFTILLLGKEGEAYNVCNNKELFSIKELAELLVSIYPEKKLSVEYRSRKSTENYVENPFKKAVYTSTTKLELLNWKPQYSVRDGFKRTVDYFAKGNIL